MFQAFGDFLARRSPRYGLIAGVVLIAIAVLMLWTGGYFGRWGGEATASAARALAQAGLRVDAVTVKGVERVSEEDVLAEAGVRLDDPILGLDLREVRAKVERLGWVETAATSRLLPDAINISVVERTPAAVWQNDGRFTLIDASGAHIERIAVDDYADLPLLVDDGADAAAAELLTALAAHDFLNERVEAAIRVGSRRWDLRLVDDAVLKLPEDGAADALALLQSLHDKHGFLDRDIEYVDLRSADNVYIRPRGAAPAIIARDEDRP